MELTIVKVKGTCRWAVKAETETGIKRYRGFIYKKDAEYDLAEWETMPLDQRNFNHNFHTAEELNLTETGK